MLLDEPLLPPVEPVAPDEPLELGEPVEPALEPEPMLLPVLDELPPDAPVLLEPDLLKCSSHSERETEPSLFLSTDEKLGVEELPPVEPEADGEDDEDEDGLDAEGLDDDEDDCATANVDRANMTAAAVMLRRIGIELLQVEVVDGLRGLRRNPCARSARSESICARGGAQSCRAPS